MLPLLAATLSGCADPHVECRADVHAWEDQDGDGYGAKDLGLVCALEEGQADRALDCDDTDPAIHPGVHERCDQIDNDCDGSIDEDLRKTQAWFLDSDGDGYGGRYPSQLACASPGEDWVETSDDCDDTDPAVNPEAMELCGGGDEDCDGLYDEDDDNLDPASMTTYYLDADGDHAGDRTRSVQGCHLPPGYAENSADCDDADPTFTYLTLFVDADGDGYGDPNATTPACQPQQGKVTNGDDCDDSDPEVMNERDWYVDPDGDGYGSGPSQGFGCTAPRPGLVGFGGDCDEGDVFTNPGIREQCTDGLDQNCNGEVDCEDDQCSGNPHCMPPCADDTLTGATPITVTGSTMGAGNDLSGICGGSTAPDVAYWFVPSQTRQYTIDTAGSNYDTLIYVRSQCGQPDLACDDDSPQYGLQSLVTVNLTAGQGVLIVVDGFSWYGTYVLNVR